MPKLAKLKLGSLIKIFRAASQEKGGKYIALTEGEIEIWRKYFPFSINMPVEDIDLNNGRGMLSNLEMVRLNLSQLIRLFIDKIQDGKVSERNFAEQEIKNLVKDFMLYSEIEMEFDTRSFVSNDLEYYKADGQRDRISGILTTKSLQLILEVSELAKTSLEAFRRAKAIIAKLELSKITNNETFEELREKSLLFEESWKEAKSLGLDNLSSAMSFHVPFKANKKIKRTKESAEAGLDKAEFKLFERDKKIEAALKELPNDKIKIADLVVDAFIGDGWKEVRSAIKKLEKPTFSNFADVVNEKNPGLVVNPQITAITMVASYIIRGIEPKRGNGFIAEWIEVTKKINDLYGASGSFDLLYLEGDELSAQLQQKIDNTKKVFAEFVDLIPTEFYENIQEGFDKIRINSSETNKELRHKAEAFKLLTDAANAISHLALPEGVISQGSKKISEEEQTEEAEKLLAKFNQKTAPQIEVIQIKVPGTSPQFPFADKVFVQKDLNAVLVTPSKINSSSIFADTLRGNNLRIFANDNSSNAEIISTLRDVVVVAVSRFNSENANPITERDMFGMIDCARKTGGLSHKVKVAQDGSKKTSYNKDETQEIDPRWKKLSKMIQDGNAEVGIYSGRKVEDRLKKDVVGLRSVFAFDILVGEKIVGDNSVQAMADLSKEIFSNAAAANANVKIRKEAADNSKKEASESMRGFGIH